jgi:hypothetical protein
VNVIRFSMHQNASKEMFFEEQEKVFVFCFNQLVDEDVHKLFGVEGHDLLWGNDKWLDEGDVVY